MFLGRGKGWGERARLEVEQVIMVMHVLGTVSVSLHVLSVCAAVMDMLAINSHNPKQVLARLLDDAKVNAQQFGLRMATFMSQKCVQLSTLNPHFPTSLVLNWLRHLLRVHASHTVA